MNGAENHADRITVAVPTYGREAVLVDTLSMLLSQTGAPDELLVVDQTPCHEEETGAALRAWDAAGAIRWLRLSPPSITRAMNTALVEAAGPVVLFLDDDVIPAPGLVAKHAAAYRDPSVWAVVGQVLQPGEEPTDCRLDGGMVGSPHANAGPAVDLALRVRKSVTRSVTTTVSRDGLWRDIAFRFNSTMPAEVHNVMAGNLSVRRERALQIGGFDENFVRVAYRFETDFARRICCAGGRILFEPRASIRHLRAPSGGTRTYIDHRRSHRPDHSVGDYYYAFRHGGRWERWMYSVWRLVRSVATRYHLHRPWWIVPKLIGECRGLGMAVGLVRRGPTLLRSEDTRGFGVR